MKYRALFASKNKIEIEYLLQLIQIVLHGLKAARFGMTEIYVSYITLQGRQGVLYLTNLTHKLVEHIPINAYANIF